MRILVHEFFSGGGLAGRDVPVSLAREGSAMLAALVADLAAISGHQIVTTADPRFPLKAPPGVEVVTLSARSSKRILERLIASADAVWLIAPESGRTLERLAASVEKQGKTLLGSSSSAIRMASDKAGLPRIFALHGIPHPQTRVFSPQAVRELGYPMVVKPARGAGCEGVWLVRNARELRHAVGASREDDPHGPCAASALRARYGRQRVAVGRWTARRGPYSQFPVHADFAAFLYRGGQTPLDHPLSQRAAQAAVRACEALPGLRGYVGVDVVLTKAEPCVIEVNPRLTTAYLGVRSVMDDNVAALALAACAGTLPQAPAIGRCDSFHRRREG